MHPLVELVKDKKVFLPCVSPVIVDNNGRKFAVPCGKCKCCLEKKSQIWRTRLKRESEDNKFQLFFTLTYDNLHVPFFRPAQDASLFVLDDSKGFKFEGDDEVSYSPKYSVDSSLYDSSVHPITNFDVDRSFGVVSRRDVQNFLKRFRWHLKYLLLKRLKLRFYDKLFSFVRSLGYDDSQPFFVWLDELDSDLYEDLYLPVYNFYLKEYEKTRKKRIKLPATLFAVNIPLQRIDPIIMESFGLKMKMRTGWPFGLYLRLGRCVIKGISMSSPSQEMLTIMLRNMLLAILICLRFYRLNLPARSSWLVKTQLSGISLLVQNECKKCTINEIYSKVVNLLREKDMKILFPLFPKVLSLDISQSVSAMARCLIMTNYAFIHALLNLDVLEDESLLI